MTNLRNRSRIVISILDELWLHALPWEGIYTDDARPKSSDSFSFLKQTTKFPCLKPLRLMLGPYMLHWDTLGASMWGENGERMQHDAIKAFCEGK